MAVDATIGGTTANSYLTVAAADAVAATVLGRFAEAWRAATIPDKEAALIRATQEIDLEIGRTTYGPRITGQALLFPRWEDIDDAGAPIIPGRIVRAVYQQAAYLLVNATQIDEAASRRSKGFSSYVNPDGTGGTLANRSDYGRLHPDVAKLLGEFQQGATVAWIRTT